MHALESKTAAIRERILAGRIVNEEMQFTFEMWGYAPITSDLLQRGYGDFMAQQDTFAKHKSLRGITIRQLTNHGFLTA